MERACIICGKTFICSPSDKKITCSKGCSAIRKSQTHKGKKNVWPDEARAQLSAKGKTANLHLGTPAAAISPKSGPYESNINAKWWVLESPDGKIYRVKNLNLFAREHCHEYDSTPIRMAAGIRQIKRSEQGKTPRAVSQWKGWRLVEWDD